MSSVLLHGSRPVSIRHAKRCFHSGIWRLIGCEAFWYAPCLPGEQIATTEREAIESRHLRRSTSRRAACAALRNGRCVAWFGPGYQGLTLGAQFGLRFATPHRPSFFPRFHCLVARVRCPTARALPHHARCPSTHVTDCRAARSFVTEMTRVATGRAAAGPDAARRHWQNS